MNRPILVLIVCLCTSYSWTSAQGATAKAGDHVGVIRTVTLYRDRALVTREIAVPAGEKTRTIIVPNLPQSVIADSVYADGDERTVIRAVRVSPRVTTESNREEVRALEKQIVVLNDQRSEVQKTLDGLATDLETLPAEVLESVEFDLVKTMDEVMDAVLTASPSASSRRSTMEPDLGVPLPHG